MHLTGRDGARNRRRRACGGSATLHCVCLGIAMLAPVGCGSTRPGDIEAGASNLILISIDTLRADHIGAYGATAPTSPTLDALAAKGVLYTHAFATSPWTLPSHGSMLTGLYPNRHALRRPGQSLSTAIPTLASVLARAGFATAGIVNSIFLSESYGLARGFESLHYVPEIATRGNVTYVRNAAPEITTRALRWLDERDARPFFLFLHYYDPHSDYSPARRYRRMFVESYGGTIDGSTVQLRQVAKGQRKLSEEDVAHVRQLYDAEIRQLDDSLAVLVRHLDLSGLSESTALVISSDHGEEFMEHGRMLHGRTYYEEVIAVPLILRGPGVPRGVRIDAVASVADITPTILGLLGVEPPPNLQGIDLCRDWSSDAGRRRPYAVAEAAHEDVSGSVMIRGASYKLVYERLGARARLYDLERDPMERRDVAADRPEPLARLMAWLRAYERVTSAPEAPATPPASEEDLLRRLGYLD